MVTPLICLFIAFLLPFIWGTFQAIGRHKQFSEDFDNKNPRAQQSRLTGMAARAHAAHSNAFEALILFAPTVIVAMWVSGGDSEAAITHKAWIARLSVVFIIARIGHGAAYLADQDKLRSALFGIGLLSMISMWVMILRAAL